MGCGEHLANVSVYVANLEGCESGARGAWGRGQHKANTQQHTTEVQVTLHYTLITSGGTSEVAKT